MKTYFVDTNYLLRLLLKDQPKQFRVVYNLFQKGIEGRVELVTSTIVIFELYWVLKSFYKKEKGECVDKLEKILTMHFLQVEKRKLILNALALYRETALDLEDCYNIAFFFANQLDEFGTFDKEITKLLKKT